MEQLSHSASKCLEQLMYQLSHMHSKVNSPFSNNPHIKQFSHSPGESEGDRSIRGLIHSQCLFALQVGKAMSSNETAAYKIMRLLDVDYVLVIFGGVIGYSGDDINKFLWMVRIAEGEHPKDIRVSRERVREGTQGISLTTPENVPVSRWYTRERRVLEYIFSLDFIFACINFCDVLFSQESDYFTPQGEFRVDSAGSQTLLNCLMYKLSYYRFGDLQVNIMSSPSCTN